MCVIVHLLANKSIEDTKLFNAAANNWHSWGIITKKPDGLDVIKKVPEIGAHEDFEEIKKYLNDNIEHDRFIHLRHTTRGVTDADNCHPFSVFKNQTRECFMMHNGTYNALGNNVISDTKELVDTLLMPSLQAWHGERGYGDYSDEVWNRIVFRPHWNLKGASSRLLFIANDIEPMRVGTWVTYVDDKQDPSFYASNSDYFDKVTRGPFFVAQQEKERKEMAARQAELVATRRDQNTTTGNGTNTTGATAKNKIMEYFPSLFQSDPDIEAGVIEAFESQNISSQDISEMAMLSFPEYQNLIDHFVKQNRTGVIAAFIDYLVTEYVDVYSDFQQIARKQKAAEQKIIELKKQAEISTPPVLKVVGGSDVA